MTATETSMPKVPAGTGAPLIISYEELVRIRSAQEKISAQLEAVLALTGRVNEIERRVIALETVNAREEGARSTWKSIKLFVAGLVTSAIGGGALMYLPKLWGG